MAPKNRTEYPLGERSARVLSGKVLMKAGADRRTLSMLRSLIKELEMDKKALVLSAAFPTLLWTGQEETDKPLEDNAVDPERPVILFSILDRVADKADVQHMTRTWEEQKLAYNSPAFLLGSVAQPVAAPVRWLKRLRAWRHYTPSLEKLCILLVGIQLAGLGWLLKPRRPPVLAVMRVSTPLPTPTLQPKPEVGPTPLPVATVREFEYHPGGKLTIHWKSAGAGYRYLIYTAKDSQLRGVRPVSSQATVQTEFTWKKNSVTNWLAIRVLDPSGRLGPFSEPIFVGL